MGELEFQKVIDSKEIVYENTLNYIEEKFTKGEQQ